MKIDPVSKGMRKRSYLALRGAIKTLTLIPSLSPPGLGFKVPKRVRELWLGKPPAVKCSQKSEHELRFALPSNNKGNGMFPTTPSLC